MKIDQIAVVTIQLKQLIPFQASCVDVVFNVDVLVWQYVLRFAMLVSWGLNVVNFQISMLFSFIDCEEEVLSCHNFLVSCLAKLFFVKLVFKVLQNQLFLYDFIDLCLYLFNQGNVAVCCLQGLECSSLLTSESQLLEVLCFVICFFCSLNNFSI